MKNHIFFWAALALALAAPVLARIETLPSGLRYEILQAGNSNTRSSQKRDIVTVHYTGWINVNDNKGQKFDSSLDRGQPFSFILGNNSVIQGWEQGVQNMKIGEKRRLYVPARLGYGAQAVGDKIPANSDLIFEVQLLKIS